ncbi:ZIP family metal transporter [Candidatus Micrarchaeota archaeon]|nr:ZIP family metal transporter [Candidatus Micrarchaeota archaeon]
MAFLPFAEVFLALAAGLSNFISGLLPLYTRVRNVDTRYIIGFSAGAMLAVVFAEILPEIRVEANFPLLALGFFSFYLMEKLIMIHSCGEKECDSHAVGWVAVFGMSSDNIVDGAGIAAGYVLNPLTGVLITLAVILHEIPQGITTAILMAKGKFGRRKTFLALGAQAALYPIGAALAFLLPPELKTPLMAFVAGDFLYIAASDLLPEAHKRFNLQVVASVLLGAITFYAIEVLVKL